MALSPRSCPSRLTYPPRSLGTTATTGPKSSLPLLRAVAQTSSPTPLLRGGHMVHTSFLSVQQCLIYTSFPSPVTFTVFSPGPSPLAQSIVSQPHSKQQHPYLSYSPFAPNPNTPRATAGVQNTLVDAIDIDPASINGPRSSSSPSDPSELTPIFVDSDSDTDFDMHEDCNSRVGGKHDSDSEMLCRSRPLDIVDCDRSEHFRKPNTLLTIIYRSRLNIFQKLQHAGLRQNMHCNMQGAT